MNVVSGEEIIVIRSLTDSDLGIFAAHRPTTSSKQRAININAQIAQRLLSSRIIEKEEAHIPCRLIFGEIDQQASRHFGKVGKNWRLGGNKIEGDVFLDVDSKDFALIRSVEGNDGFNEITILFISRTSQKMDHARIVRMVETTIKDSMEIYRQGSAGFQELATLFPSKNLKILDSNKVAEKSRPKIPLMPREVSNTYKQRTTKEKLQSPHILELMLKASGDLSAPAQLNFFNTIELLSSQLREVLLASNKIIKLEKDHKKTWQHFAGNSIGFVDGGLANLSMLGSVPIAARVGGYIVKPGDRSPERERFITLKKMINELYTYDDGGVYINSFPDVSALRDAARISIEAAGAVKILTEDPALKYVFLHGALVNPVSRYTDIMKDKKAQHRFPNFSQDVMPDLLSELKPNLTGRNANFINVYLKQLTSLIDSTACICGIIEREATTSSVIKAVLNSLPDQVIAPHLPVPPAEWKKQFRAAVDPGDDDEGEGQRITDTLLFKCVLEPGEVLVPIEIDRNEMRRAPEAWKDIIVQYPKPMVSYLQPTEWAAPIRIELFSKDISRFEETANLIFHCSLLLPRYAFPAGLNIVDKFARIPNWMTKPINTNTAVQSLKRALDSGDDKLFDSLRRMLCGSSREWMLRPGLIK